MYISDNELNILKNKIDALERFQRETTDLLKGVRGSLVVQGYAGKRLDINDNLNVVNLNKAISDIKERLDDLGI